MNWRRYLLAVVILGAWSAMEWWIFSHDAVPACAPSVAADSAASICQHELEMCRQDHCSEAYPP